jgi:hypothetical protein
MATRNGARPQLRTFEVQVERTVHLIMTGTVRIRAETRERALELLEADSRGGNVGCETIMALVDKNGGAEEEFGDCEEYWNPTGDVRDVT